jgi:predicted DNA-binding transcriptional regulator AlpA
MGKATSQTKPKAKPAKPAPTLPPGCEAFLSKQQICFALGVSLRTLQSMLTTGEFPKPDARIGKFPRWRVASFNAWVRMKCGVKDE